MNKGTLTVLTILIACIINYSEARPFGFVNNILFLDRVNKLMKGLKEHERQKENVVRDMETLLKASRDQLELLQKTDELVDDLLEYSNQNQYSNQSGY